MTTYGEQIKNAIDNVLYDTTAWNIEKMIQAIRLNYDEVSNTEIKEVAEQCFEQHERERNA